MKRSPSTAERVAPLGTTQRSAVLVRQGERPTPPCFVVRICSTTTSGPSTSTTAPTHWAPGTSSDGRSSTRPRGSISMSMVPASSGSDPPGSTATAAVRR